MLTFGLSLATPAGASETSAKTAAAARAKGAPAAGSPADDSRQAVPLGSSGFGSFTPSILSAGRLPAANARGPSRGQVSERSFRFTPAGGAAPRKSVAVGLTTKVVTAAAPAPDAVADADGYGLGVELGYRGFSMFGGYSLVGQTLGSTQREMVDVGLGYRGGDWTTSLQVGREELQLNGLDAFDLSTRYSVELGGAYELAPRLLLSGGVRYKLSPTGELTRFEDDRADSAVYLSTAFSF